MLGQDIDIEAVVNLEVEGLLQEHQRVSHDRHRLMRGSRGEVMGCPSFADNRSTRASGVGSQYAQT